MPIAADVQLAPDVIIYHPELVNIYGCVIGSQTRIGSFVEIQKNAVIGARCKISSHSFICEGVSIEDEVFVGHGVVFINDRYPRATVSSGRIQTERDWVVTPIRVSQGATIGSGAVIMCGVTVGRCAMIGAGAVITRNVGEYAVVAGVPGRIVGDMRQQRGLQ